MADFVSGDTASTLLVTCQDDSGTAINLSGAAVNLHWKDEEGTALVKAMTVVSASVGTCSYQFATGELFAPGMAFEVEITDVSGKKLTNIDVIAVTVREQIA